MNTFTKRGEIAGPVGPLSVAVDTTTDLPERGLAVVCHPHPLQGGTMDNKVVTTVARALVQRGWRVVRFNYRGVGASEGRYGEGKGEIDDARAALRVLRAQLPRAKVTVCGYWPAFGSPVPTRETDVFAVTFQLNDGLDLTTVLDFQVLGLDAADSLYGPSSPDYMNAGTLNTDGSDISGLGFAHVKEAGKFDFQIDQLRID